jgi:hypothetical protein
MKLSLIGAWHIGSGKTYAGTLFLRNPIIIVRQRN